MGRLSPERLIRALAATGDRARAAAVPARTPGPFRHVCHHCETSWVGEPRCDWCGRPAELNGPDNGLFDRVRMGHCEPTPAGLGGFEAAGL